MDNPQLAQALTQFLTPYLPLLVKADEKISKSVLWKTASDTWEFARDEVWSVIHSSLKKDAKGWLAAEELSKSPYNRGFELLLESRLEDILQKDLELAKKVAGVLSSGSNVIQRVIAERRMIVSDVQQQFPVRERVEQETIASDESVTCGVHRIK
jgi:hypothetical protein